MTGGPGFVAVNVRCASGERVEACSGTRDSRLRILGGHAPDPESPPMTSTTRQVSLTGIKTTGDPHIGNLIGAIRPALELTSRYESMYFLADYHALTTVRDPEELAHSSRSVAATWLAAGLDPERSVLYRQSDLPEVFELSWVLSCLTAKGLMNRAHAYKAARDLNRELGRPDLDAGVNMGLFNYPVLMAADILIADADVVPVGRDQMQHVEMAADVAGSFNHAFGDHHRLKIPRAVVGEGVAANVPGVDGRKMSKSYGNTIPLLAEPKALRRTVRRIATDSTGVDEPKDPDSSVPYQLLALFAEPAPAAETAERLRAGGMGWGELKDLLADVLTEALTPIRERYHDLIRPDSDLDAILADGRDRARDRARTVLDGVRAAVGVAAKG